MSAAPIDWNSNAPVLDPDGQLHAIPLGLVPQAISQPGAKRAVPMVAPTGEHRWVPEDQIQPAVQAGGKISWPSEQIPQWFGFTPSNVASNLWGGVKGAVKGVYDLGSDLASNPNWFEGSGSTYSKFVGQPAEQQVVQAGQALNAGHPVAAAGHALASAVPLVGPWAAGLGEQAGSGDVGGAAAQGSGAYMAGQIPRLVGAAIPSKARSARAAAGMEQAYAQHPIPNSNLTTAYNTIAQNFQRLGKPVPPEIQTYMDDLNAHNAAANSPALQAQLQGAGIGDPGKFGESYARLKLINNIINSSGGFGPPDPDTSLRIQALKQFGEALSKDIKEGVAQPSAVAPNGFANDFNNMQTEYRRASQIQRGANAVGPAIGGGIGYELGSKFGSPMDAYGGALIGGTIGSKLIKPVVGSMVDSVLNRTAPTPPPPSLIPLPLIPRTASEYHRTMLAAKDGDISPGELNRRLANGGASTKVRPLPKPPE